MTILKPISKIAVGLACYKPDIGQFRQQLQSIQGQTFTSWRCFVCFDHDMTAVYSHPEIQRFVDDPRFHFFQNSAQLGHVKNFEQTITQAIDSDYDFEAFAFSDQDDVWMPQKLAASVDALSKSPRLSAVHSDSYLLIDDGQKPYRASQTTWASEQRLVENFSMTDLMVQDIATGGSMLIDAELVKKFRHIEIAHHDWWFSIVAAANGGLYPIYEPLYEYRQHGANVLGAGTYTGFFDNSRYKNKLSWALKDAYFTSRQVIDVTMRDVYRFSFGELFLLGRTLGFGVSFGLLIKGFIALFRNRPLARRCWVRVAGQLLCLLNSNDLFRGDRRQ